jgi:hypothetical protein
MKTLAFVEEVFMETAVNITTTTRILPASAIVKKQIV